jgi:hypothetical protein
LCNTLGEYPWIIFVTNIGKVYKCQPIIFICDAIRVFDPLSPKRREPNIHSIVKFPYFLYEPVVSDVVSGFINRIYANTTILICDTLVVFCLRIVGVPLISYACHDGTLLDGPAANLVNVVSSMEFP